VILLVDEGDQRSLCVVNDQLVGNPQEESMMSIAACFPSVKKPRFVDQEKSRQ
jgi:hypothetical protein